MRTYYSPTLRIISAVTLTFFSWTFLSLWQIPAAIAAEKQKPAARDGKKQMPEETFEGVLADLREQIGKAGEKNAKGEDDSAEIREIGNRKAQLADLNAKLQVEFAETEKKISRLPREIRDRHAAFVKNYTDNYITLKSELNDLDAAKTPADRKIKIEKVRHHLEKTSPKSKHIPLDPNRLPHRQVRGKEKAPRLKKEEFERDFPKQKSRNSRNIADSRLLPDFLAHVTQQKPVLLAFNEIAGDIPFSLGVNPINPLIAFADSTPILLAQQTADLPSPEDLSENGIDIQFTPAIRAKAQELGCSAVRMYEFTRNSIEFTPTYGSIQGADMCLQTKQCNAFDTSSLLIAMFRSCNIPARYTYGTIEVPIEKIMNWTGNFTDPRAAINFVASGGTLIKPYASGGVITKAQLEHVFVETYVPYGPYSGRPSNLNPDKIWVPLDPSYKQYTYTNGLDLQSAVPFDARSFANQVQSTATITAGYVTNVNSNYIQTTMTNYQAQVQNYISQNKPNATVGDIIGKKEIKKQEFGILPVTLPYNVITVGAKYSEVPDNLRHKISLNLLDENGTNAMISITKSLPEIAGKKLTLSYSPATSADEATLINYANSTASSIPVYLINLKPELRIDGQVIAAGNSVGMGKSLPFNINLISPVSGSTLISNNNTVGTYTAIVLDLSIMTATQLDKIKARVTATKAKLDANDLTNISKDDVMGEFLNGIGSSYWGILDTTNKICARANFVSDVRLPSEGTFTYDLSPTYLFGVPISAIPSGFMTDISSDNHVVVAGDGVTSKEINYMTQSGMFGSRMEASVYDLAFNKAYTGKGITTAHLFEFANQQGIPLYTINNENKNTVLPTLSLPQEIITDIQSALNSGKSATVPKTTITKDGWTGTGYLIFDPRTGSGAYKISGGLSGGGYTCNCWGFSPGTEALIGLGLFVLSFFAPIAAAVLSVVDGVISLASLFCQINDPTKNLTPGQKTVLKGLAVFIFAGGVLLTIAGVMFVPGILLGLGLAASPFAALAVAVALISIFWLVLNLFMTWLIEQMIDNFSNLNNQKQAVSRWRCVCYTNC